MRPIIVLLILSVSVYVSSKGRTSGDITFVQERGTCLQDKVTSLDSNIYFKANGVDPIWSLTLAEDKVVFRTHYFGTSEYIMPHAEPVRVEESQIKKYSLHAEAGQMEIELEQQLCQNANSKERFTYAVRISFKRNVDSTYTDFTGCGRFMTNLELESKWVLFQIKSDTIIPSDTSVTMPYLELHTSGNMFSGFGGCNSIYGRLFLERHLLRFIDLNLGKKTCATMEAEKEFVMALQFSTQYKIEDHKLFLSNPDGTTLVFSKSE